MILGGVHGDEPKGVRIALQLIELLGGDRKQARGTRWVVIPIVNPDGYNRRKRRNARRVDLNRNFPTANWERTSPRSRMYGGDAPASEPETQAIITTIKRYRPARVITIHSIGERRYCNNFDGPALDLALRMQRYNDYPVVPSIGYPTPGSLGTWAGRERQIPTVTLELPSHHSPRRCWEDNRAALLATGSPEA